MIGFDQVEYAGVTDVGMVRPHNQDYHAVLLATDPEQWQQAGHIFLVADGMGGHAVGELASELAAGIIPHTYHKYCGDGPDAALRKAFQEANASIYARGQQNTEFQGMGTTATALLLRGEDAWVAHVGDSRAYRIRGGQIEQLTFDHSLVWEMARRQKIDPASLNGFPRKNIILRSLGPESAVKVDVEGPHPLRPGDTFVLCSDGLSNQLSDKEIGAVASVLPPAEACRFLVNLANLRGGPDNITVLIVHAAGTPPAEPDPAPPVDERRGRPPPIPWFLKTLFVGVVFALAAAVCAALNLYTGIYAFVLAALVLLAGLAGLCVHYFRYRERPTRAAPGRPRLRVYRRTSCAIDVGLLNGLNAAGSQLQRWLREKKWDADWGAYQRHRDLADGFRQSGDLAAAFREYCRAVRPFTEALQQHRQRDEVFRPVWEGEPKPLNRDT